MRVRLKLAIDLARVMEPLGPFCRTQRIPG